MSSWAEFEVHRLIRLAWEVGLAAGNLDGGRYRKVVGDVVSAHVGATAWVWLIGKVERSLPTLEVEWTEKLYSEFAPSTYYPTCAAPCSQRWRALAAQAGDQQSAASIVVETAAKTSAGEKQLWHTLSRLYVDHNGDTECLEFLRPATSQLFTELEHNFVSIMLASLCDMQREFVQNALGTKPTETAPKIELPKRQREVLELLLRGASIKEIASTLGISPHTVNDYSKSLYRHFAVCGRAELAALFANPSHSQWSPSELCSS